MKPHSSAAEKEVRVADAEKLLNNDQVLLAGCGPYIPRQRPPGTDLLTAGEGDK